MIIDAKFVTFVYATKCSDGNVCRIHEKETGERRREMKAKETAVQFYKEKVIQLFRCLFSLNLNVQGLL